MNLMNYINEFTIIYAAYVEQVVAQCKVTEVAKNMSVFSQCLTQVRKDTRSPARHDCEIPRQRQVRGSLAATSRRKILLAVGAYRGTIMRLSAGDERKGSRLSTQRRRLESLVYHSEAPLRH